MLYHTPFFLRHDPNVSVARRVFGYATLGELGVVLTNLLLFVPTSVRVCLRPLWQRASG